MRLRTAEAVLHDYKAWAKQPDNRVKLGLPGLDQAFRGVAPGEVALMVARSYVGKTNVLVNIICNNLDTPQLVVSLEMPGRQVVSRMVAVTYDLSYRDLEMGVRNGHYEDIFEQATRDFQGVQVCDEPGLTIPGLCDAISKTQPRLVTIDYLELMGGDRKDALNHVVLTATALKDVAKEYGVSIVVLHQVGRGERNAGHKPLAMVDARYGGETQADYVFGLYRPSLDPELDHYDRLALEGRVVLQALKNRDGTLFPDQPYYMNPDTLRMEIPPGSTPTKSEPDKVDKGTSSREEGHMGQGTELPGQISIEDALERATSGSY